MRSLCPWQYVHIVLSEEDTRPLFVRLVFEEGNKERKEMDRFARIDHLREGEDVEGRSLYLLEELKAGRITVADLMGPVAHLPNLSAEITIPPGDKSLFPAAPNAEFLPKDESNKLLDEHVHPHDYVNPTPPEDYDMVVIGAGVAGLISSIMGAWLGKRVAMIERHAMGGDCLNTGCVPSKAVIACAKAFHHVKDLAKFGVHVEGNVSIDFGAVMERMRKIRAKISHHDSVQRYSKEFCEHVYVGNATFVGDHAIEVIGDDGSKRLLRFKKAMIGTGASAAVPPNLVGIPHLTNSSFFNLTQLPPRVIFVGCGPIGLELAQSLARFGSKVMCFERADRLLIREDPQAAAILQAALARDGVELYFNAIVHSFTTQGEANEATGEGLYHAPWLQYSVTVEINGEHHVYHADCVMNATGRAPNVHGLGLENVGVEYDNRRGVHVNDFYQTTHPDIYACGDCTSPYKFTHAADFQARIAVRNMFLGGEIARASDLLIPWCTYTDPEIAHVGKYEDELDRKGIAYETFVRHLKDVDRCLCDGVEEGFVKLIVQAGTQQIVGATICGPNAGDMISEVTVCMQYGITVPQLAGTIHPYPTTQESIRQACLGFNKYFKNPQGPALLALKRFMTERDATTVTGDATTTSSSTTTSN